MKRLMRWQGVLQTASSIEAIEALTAVDYLDERFIQAVEAGLDAGRTILPSVPPLVPFFLFG